MTRSLDLDENHSLKQFGEHINLDAPFDFYFRCPNQHLLHHKQVEVLWFIFTLKKQFN